jgi:hypothetical protein
MVLFCKTGTTRKEDIFATTPRFGDQGTIFKHLQDFRRSKRLLLSQLLALCF